MFSCGGVPNTSDKWSAAIETVNPSPSFLTFSNCWTLSAFTSFITKLLRCNEKGEEGGGKCGGLRDTTSTFAACINHQANKLKAKWLLALDIYHRGKPNEALYTLEDRGMLLFITVICGWLPWLKASEIRVKLDSAYFQQHGYLYQMKSVFWN